MKIEVYYQLLLFLVITKSVRSKSIRIPLVIISNDKIEQGCSI